MSVNCHFVDKWDAFKLVVKKVTVFLSDTSVKWLISLDLLDSVVQSDEVQSKSVLNTQEE